ncbi:ATP-dependent RecD-like DNA helicase [Pleomorphomonas sp. PLEO]|uniref:ATP-dependent DNA helicase n=1 Tax=Pleomorphomonas sp. PLEO TaxID=3239306 RepID=UPI00351E3FB9
MITPSAQQDAALKAVSKWLKKNRGQKPWFYLGGFAGTGKTTLAKRIAEDVKGKVTFGAFTGKAALVLRSKGCEHASTIHSMIYKPREDVPGVTEFVINRESHIRSSALVIIDEVSMVGEDLGKDLLSFGVPVLVLGDPGQLPPVKSEGFFTKHEPDFMLTDVHRQAAENPIIRMSMDIREGRAVGFGAYGESRVIPTGIIGRKEVLAADQVLCGLNRTRTENNQKIRRLKGIDSFWPTVGERIVCLKNNRDKGLLNGGLWEVAKIVDSDDEAIIMIVLPIDAGMVQQGVEVTVHRAFFEGTERELPWYERARFDEFDFGYALTVHKAQGSQWDDVIVFDESRSFRADHARWLYTAVTRAAEKVTVVR